MFYSKKAFTLVEVIVALCIVTVVAGSSVGAYSSFIDNLDDVALLIHEKLETGKSLGKNTPAINKWTVGSTKNVSPYIVFQDKDITYLNKVNDTTLKEKTERYQKIPLSNITVSTNLKDNKVSFSSIGEPIGEDGVPLNNIHIYITKKLFGYSNTIAYTMNCRGEISREEISKDGISKEDYENIHPLSTCPIVVNSEKINPEDYIPSGDKVDDNGDEDRNGSFSVGTGVNIVKDTDGHIIRYEDGNAINFVFELPNKNISILKFTLTDHDNRVYYVRVNNNYAYQIVDGVFYPESNQKHPDETATFFFTVHQMTKGSDYSNKPSPYNLGLYYSENLSTHSICSDPIYVEQEVEKEVEVIEDGIPVKKKVTVKEKVLVGYDNYDCNYKRTKIVGTRLLVEWGDKIEEEATNILNPQ